MYTGQSVQFMYNSSYGIYVAYMAYTWHIYPMATADVTQLWTRSESAPLSTVLSEPLTLMNPWSWLIIQPTYCQGIFKIFSMFEYCMWANSSSDFTWIMFCKILTSKTLLDFHLEEKHCDKYNYAGIHFSLLSQFHITVKRKCQFLLGWTTSYNETNFCLITVVMKSRSNLYLGCPITSLSDHL